MIDREKELFLSKANNSLDDLYAQDVRKSVAREFKTGDELAMHRKMMKEMFELIVELHGSEVRSEVIDKFMAYFDRVEQIKSDVKEELGLNENTDI